MQDLKSSRVLRFADMPARTSHNGSESRIAIRGQLPTGECVAVHESVQPASIAPNPAHRIEHSEIICVREGAVEFMHDGITDHAAAGDVLLVAKGTMHTVRNVGSGSAAYFVVAIGGDVGQF